MMYGIDPTPPENLSARRRSTQDLDSDSNSRGPVAFVEGIIKAGANDDDGGIDEEQKVNQFLIQNQEDGGDDDDRDQAPDVKIGAGIQSRNLGQDDDVDDVKLGVELT